MLFWKAFSISAVIGKQELDSIKEYEGRQELDFIACRGGDTYCWCGAAHYCGAGQICNLSKDSCDPDIWTHCANIDEECDCFTTVRFGKEGVYNKYVQGTDYPQMCGAGFPEMKIWCKLYKANCDCGCLLSPVEYPCKENKDCTSGRCGFGQNSSLKFCIQTGFGWPCHLHSDCESPYRCHLTQTDASNRCVECVLDSECEDGKKCTTEGACMPKMAR